MDNMEVPGNEARSADDTLSRHRRNNHHAVSDKRPASQRKTTDVPKARTDEEKQAAAKAEYEKLLTMRSGGTYIPPARLRALQSQITDKSSKEYQRMAWEALKKSINGLINKVNVSNIKHIVPELFGENLVRGRGLFCRSMMKAQAASLPFTPIYAAMAAIVNTKLPQVGELLLKRLITQFKKGFKRNDKAVCLSASTFIAHLCNQQVASEMVAAQILLLLLNKPTDDSVEIAVGLTREVGQHLEEMSAPIALAVFDQFRSILNEADIDKRVQYMIEVLFQVRKDKYKDNAAIKEELDLVEEEDQITHQIRLDDEIDVQEGLNIFKFDADYEENEELYKKLKSEILGEGSDMEDNEQTDSDDSEDDDEAKEEKAMEIKDQSNTDLVNLRRTIYLTIMSSIDPEECCHKLMKVSLPAGQEPELPSMIIECCSQEKTYSKFYGLIGERFAKINRLWTDLFDQSFVKYYDTIHRYETNRLRNIARFFGHLISSDAIGWHTLSVVHLNEEETTSSSRIFIKILFQDLAEAMGMQKLQARLTDAELRPYFEGLFPHDNPRNTRFSINYFTSIGMGAVTEGMREFLQKMPRPALPAPPPGASHSDDDSSSVSSYSSYTGSSISTSCSPSRTRAQNSRGSAPNLPPRAFNARRGRRSLSISSSRSLTPPQNERPRRYRSYSRSVTPPRRAVRRDPPRGRSLSRSRSRSTTPPRRDFQRRPREGSPTRSRSRSFVPSRGNARYNARSMSPRRQRFRPTSRSATPPRKSSRSASEPKSPPLRRSPRRKSPSRSPDYQGRSSHTSRVMDPTRRRRDTSSVSAAPRRRMGRSRSMSSSPGRESRYRSRRISDHSPSRSHPRNSKRGRERGFSRDLDSPPRKRRVSRNGHYN